MNDVNFISAKIADNEAIMFLSKQASARGTDQRVKEIATQMHEDHTGMLYDMQQLAAAGKGSSERNDGNNKDVGDVALLNKQLSGVTGADFDSVWVAGLLTIQQQKYDELVPAKETVRNPQLKMAITSAIPIMRKQITQLKSIQKNLARIATQKRKEEAALKKQQELKKR